MSTRSTIYYHKADEETPHIHIYSEMTFEAGPAPILMEVQTQYALILIPFPADLVKRFGL
jgi:hypothetical protein